MLDAGADVNSVNKISKTPLIYAASEDHLNCLQVRVHSKFEFQFQLMSEIFFSLILHLTDKGQEISEENCGVKNLQ